MARAIESDGDYAVPEMMMRAKGAYPRLVYLYVLAAVDVDLRAVDV
jgi:hypothetical protein